jgi:hypothetical protein
MRKDELYNYSFTEFIALETEQRELYKAFGLKAGAKNLTKIDPQEWEWGRVKQIQDLVNKEYLWLSDIVEVVMVALNLKREEVEQMKWFDIARFYTFILKAISDINEKEQQLAYEPDAREINAGIEDFARFSWFATLDRLAGGDILKYDEVGKQPWSIVFTKLLLNKTDAEFNKKLIKQSHV